MGLSFYELQRMTDGFSRGHEQKILDKLYTSGESAARLTLIQAIYRHLALETAADLAVALVEANGDLEQKAQARDQVVAKIRIIEADLDAAEAALAKVGPGHRERELSPEKSAVSRLTRDHREAGKAVREAKREHSDADSRVANMTAMLTALRGVAKPDRAIVRALAEALADAG